MLDLAATTECALFVCVLGIVLEAAESSTIELPTFIGQFAGAVLTYGCRAVHCLSDPSSGLTGCLADESNGWSGPFYGRWP